MKLNRISAERNPGWSMDTLCHGGEECFERGIAQARGRMIDESGRIQIVKLFTEKWKPGFSSC